MGQRVGIILVLLLISAGIGWAVVRNTVTTTQVDATIVDFYEYTERRSGGSGRSALVFTYFGIVARLDSGEEVKAKLPLTAKRERGRIKLDRRTTLSKDAEVILDELTPLMGPTRYVFKELKPRKRRPGG